jgi:hypothetical protein
MELLLSIFLKEIWLSFLKLFVVWSDILMNYDSYTPLLAQWANKWYSNALFSFRLTLICVHNEDIIKCLLNLIL